MGNAAMKFTYNRFSCDVDKFTQNVEDFTPEVKNVYMPYHIARVKKTGYVEYNGEY